MTTSNNIVYTPEEVSAAYAVADQREARRQAEGAVIVGYKVGFTNPSLWPALGAQSPMWGALYNDTVAQAGDQPIHFTLEGLNAPRIEPEIVVHFREAPSPEASLTELLDSIDWMASGYEIVLGLPDGQPARLPEIIGNGGMHGALIVGKQCSVATLGESLIERLADVRLEMFRDGEPVEAGQGASVMGNPLNSVLHLMKGLKARGQRPLQAGDTVTTGTFTAAYPIKAGERWTTRVEGIALPGLDVTFE